VDVTGDLIRAQFVKAAWLAALVFLPLSFGGTYLQNYSGGHEILTAVGAIFVAPMLLLDLVTGNNPDQQMSTAQLWVVFAVLQYVWFWILCSGLLLSIRAFRAK